jgi:lipopolysaccharide biosynthesis glycosyltransferase
VLVFATGVSDLQRADLIRSWPTERATIKWIEAEPAAYRALPLWGHMSVATYFRLGLIDHLRPQTTKVLWLDGDLLVLADLARLWDLDLGECYLGAAQDGLVPFVASRFGVSGYRQLGLAADCKYFNAGVMLVNVELWRRDDIPGQAIAYLKRRGGSVYFWDQEALNAVAAGRWKEIDRRWNHNCGLPVSRQRAALGVPRDDDTSGQGPWILHFAGTMKPWLHPGTGWEQQLYVRYVDMTAWAGHRPSASLRARLMTSYARSRARWVTYPIEQLGTRLRRRISKRTFRG